MRRLILLGLLVLGSSPVLRGQQTVIQQLFTGVQTIPTTSVFVQNVGQSAHQIRLQFSNAPSQTCTSPAMALRDGGAHRTRPQSLPPRKPAKASRRRE